MCMRFGESDHVRRTYVQTHAPTPTLIHNTHTCTHTRTRVHNTTQHTRARAHNTTQHNTTQHNTQTQHTNTHTHTLAHAHTQVQKSRKMHIIHICSHARTRAPLVSRGRSGPPACSGERSGWLPKTLQPEPKPTIMQPEPKTTTMQPVPKTTTMHGQKIFISSYRPIPEPKNPLNRQIVKVNQPVGLESRSFSRAFWNTNSLCLEWTGSMGTRNQPEPKTTTAFTSGR